MHIAFNLRVFHTLKFIMESELSILCTPSVKSKLLEQKIHKVGELLGYKGKMYKYMERLSVKCMEQYNIPVSIKHSWVNEICHVRNSMGSIVRAVVGKIYILPRTILCKVKYLKPPHKCRMIDIHLLITMRVMWLHCIIVSDDEEEIDDETGEEMKMSHLPMFLIHDDYSCRLLKYIQGEKRLRDLEENINTIQELYAI